MRFIQNRGPNLPDCIHRLLTSSRSHIRHLVNNCFENVPTIYGKDSFSNSSFQKRVFPPFNDYVFFYNQPVYNVLSLYTSQYFPPNVKKIHLPSHYVYWLSIFLFQPVLQLTPYKIIWFIYLIFITSISITYEWTITKAFSKLFIQ
jgi:hypothetical protein